MLISLIFAAVAIDTIEGMPLLKKGKYTDFIAVTLILVIAVGMWILNSMGVPTALKILNDMLNPLGKIIFRTA